MGEEFDISKINANNLKNASDEEVQQLLKVIEEARRQKFEVIKPRQIREIVPIEQWLEKEEFVGPDGLRIYDYWKEALCKIYAPDSKISEVIITGCQNENQRIPTSIGYLSYKELKERFDRGERFNVLSEEGIKPCVDVLRTGYKDTFIITTEDGHSVEGTKEHRVRALREGEIVWVYYSDIQEGDYLLKSMSNSWVVANKDIPKGYAYTLGFLIGDGNKIKGRKAIKISLGKSSLNTESDKEIYKTLLEISSTNNVSVYEDKVRGYKQYTSTCPEFYKKYCDIGEGAENKKIPSIAYEFSLRDICDLIAGLWDSDGCVEVDNRNGRVSLSYASTSDELVSQLQSILLCLGIKSRVNKTRVKGRVNSLLRLRITDSLSLIRFRSLIKLRIKYKRDRLNTVELTKGSSIEGLQELLRSTSNLQVKRDKLHNKSQSLIRLNQLYEERDLEGESSTLDYLYNHQCYTVKVVSVKNSSCHTMDLTVQDSPTYLFDGYISHNSIGTGKCVDGTTLVEVDGVLRKIEELDFGYLFKEKIYNIMSSRGYVQTSHTYKEEVEETILLKFKGTELRGTPNHPIKINGEWVCLKDVKVGDKVEHKQYQSYTPYRDNEYYLRGFICGDGSVYPQRVMLGCSDDRLPILESYISSLGIHKYEGEDRAWVKEKAYKVYTDKRSKLRTISIYQFPFNTDNIKYRFYEPMTKNQLYNKIAGLVDTDGYICLKSGSECLEFGFESEQIILDLSNIIASLGLSATKFVKINKRYNKPYFYLRLNKQSSKLLLKDIRNLLLFKQGEVDSILATKSRNMKDVSWKVEAIEYIRKPSLVYDVTIPSTHEFLSNGLVSHNTTVSTFGMLRKLYEMSCYENISGLYNLMRTSMIAIFYFSVSRVQAQLTGFGQLKEIFDSSPYFKKYFPRDENNNSRMIMPERTLVLSGSDSSHAIGINMIASVLDEANFHEGESTDANKGSSIEYSKVAEMYATLQARGASRFMQNGKNHYISYLVSSATHASSFTEKRIKLANEKNDGTTLILSPRLWDVKPKGTYSPKVFYVFTGNSNLDPLVIDTPQDIDAIKESVSMSNTPNKTIEEDVKDIQSRFPGLISEVPVDFRSNFHDDMYKAMQDIAGISTAPTGVLFSSRPTYQKCVDPKLEHPFTKDSFVISTKSNLRVEDYLKKNYRFKNPGAFHAIHVDQSTSTDDTGISMVHLEGYKEDEFGNRLPIIVTDFKLRIEPPRKPAKISISKVREFIVYLRDIMGVNIGYVSYDQFASHEARELLEAQGFNVQYQSVDRTDEAYLQACNLLYEGRIRDYEYEPFMDEWFYLQHYRAKRKVDHVVGKKKDVSDSWVGAINGILSNLNSVSWFGDIDEEDEEVDYNEDLFTMSELAGGDYKFFEDDYF